MDPIAARSFTALVLVRDQMRSACRLPGTPGCSKPGSSKPGSLQNHNIRNGLILDRGSASYVPTYLGKASALFAKPFAHTRPLCPRRTLKRLRSSVND